MKIKIKKIDSITYTSEGAGLDHCFVVFQKEKQVVYTISAGSIKKTLIIPENYDTQLCDVQESENQISILVERIEDRARFFMIADKHTKQISFYELPKYITERDILVLDHWRLFEWGICYDYRLGFIVWDRSEELRGILRPQVRIRENFLVACWTKEKGIYLYQLDKKGTILFQTKVGDYNPEHLFMCYIEQEIYIHIAEDMRYGKHGSLWIVYDLELKKQYEIHSKIPYIQNGKVDIQDGNIYVEDYGDIIEINREKKKEEICKIPFMNKMIEEFLFALSKDIFIVQTGEKQIAIINQQEQEMKYRSFHGEIRMAKKENGIGYILVTRERDGKEEANLYEIVLEEC